MNIRNSSTQIPLPSIVDDARWIGRFSREVRKSIAALRDRKIVGGSAPFTPYKAIPFDITLNIVGASGSESYEVTIQDGWVNERSTATTAAAASVHKPSNIYTAGERTKFPLDIGDQVSLVVHVDADGGLDSSGGDPVEIAITEEDEESSHYDPAVGDESSGSGGTYYYKLGVLRGADSSHPAPWIEKFLAGSHVDHFRELPKFKKAGGSYDIFKEYDAGAGQYKTKGISEGDGIKITNNENYLEFAIDDDYFVGYSGDVTIRDCDGDLGATPPVDGTIRMRLRISNGLIVGVNETTTEQPLSNEKKSYLQSCHWVDDAPHSHT